MNIIHNTRVLIHKTEYNKERRRRQCVFVCGCAFVNAGDLMYRVNTTKTRAPEKTLCAHVWRFTISSLSPPLLHAHGSISNDSLFFHKFIN